MRRSSSSLHGRGFQGKPGRDGDLSARLRIAEGRRQRQLGQMPAPTGAPRDLAASGPRRARRCLIPSAAMPAVRTRFAPEPHGLPAHGRRAHGAVQLGLRPPRTAARSCCASRTPTRSARRASPRQAISTGSRWLGIDWDEGPFRQSERRARHAEVVERLLARGRAYRCVCTPEQIEERRAQTIAAGRQVDLRRPLPRAGARARLRPPHGAPAPARARARLAWDDLVYRPERRRTRARSAT